MPRACSNMRYMLGSLRWESAVMTRPNTSARLRQIEDNCRRSWGWHHDCGQNSVMKSGLARLVSWLSNCEQESIVNETSALNESKTARDGRHAIGVTNVTGPPRENGAINPIVTKRQWSGSNGWKFT